MPTKSANVKNEKQYEALKDKGMSKQRAAKIANSPNASHNGGKSSGSGGKRQARWDDSPAQGSWTQGRQGSLQKPLNVVVRMGMLWCDHCGYAFERPRESTEIATCPVCETVHRLRSANRLHEPAARPTSAA